MRRKHLTLFYFGIILLSVSLQMDSVHSQLDFGDDPEPRKDVEIGSEGTGGGETKSDPVDTKAPNPEESQGAASKEVPTAAEGPTTKESSPPTRSPEKSPAKPSAKPPARPPARPPAHRAESSRRPSSSPAKKTKPLPRGPPRLPERTQRAPEYGPEAHGTHGGRPWLRPANSFGQGPGGVNIVPQGICNLKADPGFCNLMIGRWYYDRRYHRCLPFLYTGCGGNYNNFFSHRRCVAATRVCGDAIGLYGHSNH